MVKQFSLSKRILVLGSSGSGKTSLSLQLGELLCIEVIHLDAYFWKPGWLSTPRAEWREIVSSLVKRPAWIMDGTYERSLDLRLPPADTVIVIESPRLACLWRVVKRKLTVDDAHRPDAPPGQRLERDFLRYIWQYPTVTRPLVFERIRQYGKERSLIVLKTPKETKQFVAQVRAQAAVIGARD